MNSYYFTMKLNPDSNSWGYVEIVADSSEKARELMINKYGLAWGFEYYDLDNIHPTDRTKIDFIVQDEILED